MDKIMDVYIAKTDYATPSEAHANLSLPAMPFELFDALDRARIQQGDELYFQVEEYYAFENMTSPLCPMTCFRCWSRRASAWADWRNI